MLPPPSASETAHDGWKLLTLCAWKNFHSQWWAASGAERIRDVRQTRTLTISQSDVYLALGVLADTGGTMYLSDEVLLMHERVSTAFREEQAGVVCTGMPHVGKSYGLVYVLLCRMASGNPVLFTASTGQSFFFDELGVWVTEAEAQCEIFPPAYNDVTTSTRPWSFVDHPPSLLQLPSPHLVHAGFLFPVYATRYEECRYYRWSSRIFAPVYHMNPWRPAELLQCLPLHPRFQQLGQSATANFSTVSALLPILELAGPTPSEVLSEVSNPGITRQRLQDLLNRAGVAEMKELALHLLVHERPHELADALVILNRSAQADPQYDNYIPEVRYKSALALSMTSARLRALGILPSPNVRPVDPQSLYEIPLL